MKAISSLWVSLLFSALSSGPAAAGCQIGSSLSELVSIERYARNPELILTDYPSGGSGLQQSIAVQAGADVDFAAEIVQLSAVASRVQKEAIGLGLRLYVTLCSRRDPALEHTIVNMLLRSGDKSLLAAYYHEENTPPDLADAGMAAGAVAASSPSAAKARTGFALSAPAASPSSAQARLPAGYLLDEGLAFVLKPPSAFTLP